MMSELTSNLGLRQEHLSPYYPQVNGQVEAVNKSLKTILQRTINLAKSNWHLMLYSALWAYQTSVKTATRFLTFSTHLRDGSSLAYRVPDPISKVGSTVISRHFTT
jgi:transposase InsO family protein